MWTSILINIAISITIIIIGHYLWNYLIETYSDKVTKDILGSQTQKYKAIIDELQQRNSPIEEFDGDDIANDLEQFLQDTLVEPPTLYTDEHL
jgi:nitrogen fixation-related uncharacterized protein